MYTLQVKSSFCGSHFLRNYKGKCENLHGHNWDIDVRVRGKELAKEGYLIDFGDIKRELNEILEEFDHRHLNDLEPFDKINPTSENIARIIFEKLKEKLPQNTTLKDVTVWETSNQSASYSED